MLSEVSQRETNTAQSHSRILKKLTVTEWTGSCQGGGCALGVRGKGAIVIKGHGPPVTKCVSSGP